MKNIKKITLFAIVVKDLLILPLQLQLPSLCIFVFGFYKLIRFNLVFCLWKKEEEE